MYNMQESLIILDCYIAFNSLLLQQYSTIKRAIIILILQIQGRLVQEIDL